ncbi:MAG: tryptophan--tRNA ligase, partial [Arcobacter skirrowii]|nr:tryptophan--tRNA ligase [Aliarcobacter skirrowii]
TDSKELDEPKEWQNCNIYNISKLFMSTDELKNLQKRYETPGEGYGHFKLTLLEKINDYFKPYEDKRAYYLNNKKEVRDILEFGASKARKIASEKIREIRDIVGLI